MALYRMYMYYIKEASKQVYHLDARKSVNEAFLLLNLTFETVLHTCYMFPKHNFCM